MWLLLFLFVSDRIGVAFGLSYLFLSPEYQGESTLLAFLLIGFAIGGLTMAFNSYSYVRIAHHFPFLAVVNKPFVRFCINNSLIPLFFIGYYIYRIISFQLTEEFETLSTVIFNASGIVIGYFIFIGLALLYFFPINKNLFELNKVNSKKISQNIRWDRFSKRANIKSAVRHRQRLYYYIGKNFKIQQSRSTKHYASSLLQSVFDQNRISTTIFEIATITTFFLIGVFGSQKYMDVPAGFSIFLLLTIVLMLLSTIHTWLRFWTGPAIIFFFFSLNWISKSFDAFRFQTQAYGLNYDKKTIYSDSIIYQLTKKLDYSIKDYDLYLKFLNNWKRNTNEEKPVLVLVNTSGGGSRNASWVFQVLRVCDSLTNNKSSRHIAMMTGASGGTVGAAFYRSLLIDKVRGKNVDLNDPKYFHQISDDLLNKLSFAASTNDLFFRYRTGFGFNSHYSYDRAMAFEKDLNENTKGRLSRSLEYYRSFEKTGKIPNLILSPCVVNDGRRILISSQGLTFLMAENAPLANTNSLQEDIDIHVLLKEQNATKLMLSSALRMNATFPFVLPMTSLPTKPEIQVMDAGARDNYGGKTTVKWLKVFEDWIKENTSGVVVLQIRDNKKIMYQEKIPEFSMLDKFTVPVTNGFHNFTRTQDYDQEAVWDLLTRNYSSPIHFVTLNLREYQKDRISLSWHLTKNEKRKIIKAISRKSNVHSFKRYCDLLDKKY